MLTPDQEEFLLACLAPGSTLCTEKMRDLLGVLALDHMRYETVKRLLAESFGNGWSPEEYDARIDARVK